MTVQREPSDRLTIAQLPGLQAERTDLSWTRSSLAFLVNGALLVIRSELYSPNKVNLIAAAIAFLLALFTSVMAYFRRRQLAVRPLPEPLAAPVALLLLGAGTLALGMVVLAMVCVG